METLILQTGVKHARIAELVRSQGDRFSVGRGYDNDLVLTDLHVAPRQLEFTRDGDGWRLRVLDRTNPVFLNDQEITGESPLVSCGDRLTVGRTRLTIHSPDHEVEKTRKLVLANLLARDARSPFTPVLFFLAVCLIDLVLSFLEGSTDLKWGEVAYGELFAGVVVVVWSGLWALAGRVVRHQHHLGLQLMATSALLLLSTLASFAVEYLAYPFHDPGFTEALDWIAIFALLALLFNLNLVIATNLLNTRAVAAVASFTVVAVVFGFNWFSESGDDEMQLYPDYSETLVPPPAPGGGVSAETYFEALGRKLDRET